MSDSPNVRKLRPRPKITLPVPGQYPHYPQTPVGYRGSPYGQTPIPVTPGTAQAQELYYNKASEYFFSQFRGIKDFTKSGLSVGEKSAYWLYEKVSSWSKRWFTHIFLVIVVFLYSIAGAFLFMYIEGGQETRLERSIHEDRNATVWEIRDLCENQDMFGKRDVWHGQVANKIEDYESKLINHFKYGFMNTKEELWTFWNSVFYCGTIYTTIGYGHIYPTTSTGQAMTIVYAIFGIPIFLIILADFGKLFTRGMKFLWAFVRRVYYTGSCRRVRRTAPVQEVMKGVQLVYDFATWRRPSQMNPEEIEEMSRQVPQTVLSVDGNTPLSQPDTPGTPALSTFAIDDEFNLPISVAITLLLAYIFIGATVYNIWEDWNFFQSFYFVFISMSTIGFGDFVPKHPIYMMCSIVYLVFGLALTSMCINVVQVKLSDSFKQASQKIGATIGFEVAVEDGSIQATAPPPVEVAEVHATIKEDDEFKENKDAPKAKAEDVNL